VASSSLEAGNTTDSASLEEALPPLPATACLSEALALKKCPNLALAVELGCLPSL
jgi:hypothetical protein